MTEKGRPSDDGRVLYRAAWVPLRGHALVMTGRYFDAIRVTGRLALDVADEMVDATNDNAGPIVHEVFDRGWMYFLVEAGPARGLSWPMGISVVAAAPTAYVGIPALWGNTWPLCWRSVPTTGARLVDVELLYETLRATTGHKPFVPARG